MRALKLLAAGYALAVYAFIFLPVAVLVLFSFQASLFPVPPFTGPSLRWYDAVLGDRRLTAGFVNSVAVAVPVVAPRGSPRFPLGLRLRPLSPARRRGLARADHRALDGQLPDHRDGPADHVQRAGCRQPLLAAGIGHVVINLPLCFAIIYSQMGDHQLNAERAARPRRAQLAGAALVLVPMLWPALFASFFLAMTFSSDELVIAFLLTRFETTLPVEIWSPSGSGLNPKTNAIGSLVFGVSIVLVLILELVVFRKPRT